MGAFLERFSSRIWQVDQRSVSRKEKISSASSLQAENEKTPLSKPLSLFHPSSVCLVITSSVGVSVFDDGGSEEPVAAFDGFWRGGVGELSAVEGECDGAVGL